MGTNAVPRHDRRALQLLALPVIYFAGAKLSLTFSVQPEDIVMIWIPNSVLLAAMFHFGWRRFAPFAAGIMVAEIAADYGTFSIAESALFGAVNVLEVTVAYLALTRWRFDPRFTTPYDIAKFVIAAPVFATLVSACGAWGVYHAFSPDAAALAYFRTWWFSDGLGLLILTPLALSVWPPRPGMTVPRTHLRWYDAAAAIVALGILIPFALAQQRMFHGVSVRTFLLVPPLVYVASRFSVRTTAAIVAAVAALVVLVVVKGQQPFGDVPMSETVTSAQELIIALSTMSLGIATLLSQHRATVRELERRVAERTASLARANDELRHLAVTDALTGVLNRRDFFERLEREMDRQQRYHHSLALIVLDIDHFKRVNDRWGHAVGDEVLRRVASTCAMVLRSSDAIARYGGEEFVVLAPETDEASARQLAERLHTAIGAAEVQAEGGVVRVTASFGVAMRHPDDTTPEQLFRRADVALYEAKAAGRDRVVVAAA